MRSYISRHSIVYTIYPRKLTLVKPNQLVESDSSRSRDLSSAICCPNLLQLFPCLPFFFFSSLYFFPITNFIASITLLVHQASFYHQNLSFDHIPFLHHLVGFGTTSFVYSQDSHIRSYERQENWEHRWHTKGRRNHLGQQAHLATNSVGSYGGSKGQERGLGEKQKSSMKLLWLWKTFGDRILSVKYQAWGGCSCSLINICISFCLKVLII